MKHSRFSSFVAPFAVAASLFGLATPSNPPIGSVQVSWTHLTLTVHTDTTGFNYWQHGQNASTAWVDNMSLNWKIGVQAKGKEFGVVYYTPWAYIQSGSERRTVNSYVTQQHRAAY